MANMRLSHMSHWKTIPYKQIDNFRDFYYEDKTNMAYYQDWDRILRYHKATGYEGIELAPWDLTEILGLFGTPQEYVAFAAERGIAVSGMFHGAEESHLVEKHEEVLAAAREAIDTLEKFGGKHLNMCPAGHYFTNGPFSEDNLRAAAEVINKIGEHALAHGIQVGLHNEFFIAINRDNHRRFLEMTDPKSVFYCLDTAQVALMGDDLLDFYDTYAERICTFHLKDTASLAVADEIRYGQDPEIRDDGWRWFWEPGEGVLPLEELWKLVKKHGFQGWVTIEDDGSPDYLAAMALGSYHFHEVLGKIYR